MKLTRTMFSIILITSFLTFPGSSNLSNLKMNQPIKPSRIGSGQQNGVSLNNESNTISSIDLNNLAVERNAQHGQSEQMSRGYAPSKELIGEFRLTFYSPSRDETDDSPFITATGAQVKPGITVAVDPRYWKLGTEFYIEGYGYVKAGDTGSMIKGPRKMDVCVETKSEAFNKGVQYRQVWVVKE